MTLPLVKTKFTYEQAREYLEDYWYWNPQEILCFEKKYFDIAKSELRLPNNPREYFKKTISFFAYSSLFGGESFTYDEAIEYCSLYYSELPEDKKRNDLNTIYQELRSSEVRLPRNPSDAYKDKGWVAIRVMFGLEELVLFTYDEAIEYCSLYYSELPEDKKRNDLNTIYQELRSSEARLPACPSETYKDKGWVAIRVMFGLEELVLFTYKEASEYCPQYYSELQEDKKRTNLNTLYQELRSSENRLPASPNQIYKDNGWVSYRAMFGLEELVLFTYEEAAEYCTRYYNKLPDDKKRTGLMTFYQELRFLEKRVPASPSSTYKDKGWVSIRVMFGLAT